MIQHALYMILYTLYSYIQAFIVVHKEDIKLKVHICMYVVRITWKRMKILQGDENDFIFQACGVFLLIDACRELNDNV